MPSFETPREPKVFVVSNRLPITVTRSEDGTYNFAASTGGLVGALQSLSSSTEFIWYGWPGLEVPEEEQQHVKDELQKNNAVPVFFETGLADKHYNGFSSKSPSFCSSLASQTDIVVDKILWPLLHYQVHEIHMSQPDWQAYRQVNIRFAETLAPELKDDDIVWIQDYHLFLLPSFLRDLLGSKRVKIGFFLHTPFPDSDFFRLLPVRKTLLESVLQSDLIGFHVPDYTSHFKRSCKRILGAKSIDSSIIYRGRTCKILTQPIGIEPQEFHAMLERPEVQIRILELLEKYRDVKLLLSIDRLDYIKGINLRLDAIESFLTHHPEWIGKLVLLQLVIPSREEVHGYRDLRTKIEQHVSRINGKFGRMDFSPIATKFTTVPKEELTALYVASDVCVVSSTRDGLNIVSLEYMACQTQRHGVLLLSEFAGSAEFLDGCIKYNPWDVDEFEDAILKALALEEEERRSMFENVYPFIAENTSRHWGQVFLDTLNEVSIG